MTPRRRRPRAREGEAVEEAEAAVDLAHQLRLEVREAGRRHRQRRQRRQRRRAHLRDAVMIIPRFGLAAGGAWD